MSVTILCPNLKCRKVLAVPDQTRGKKVRCKYCGITLCVPGQRPRTAQSEPEKAKAAE